MILDAPLTHVTLTSVLSLSFAVLLLDVYESGQAQRDAIGAGGAMLGIVIAVGGPVVALAVALASALAVSLATRGAMLRRVARQAAARLAVVCIAAVAVVLLPADGYDRLILVVAPFACLVGELFAEHLIIPRTSLATKLRLLKRRVTQEATVLASVFSAVVVLAITLPGMHEWALIPVVALLLLVHQSWAMLNRIQDTYRVTVSALVGAAEAPDSPLYGHGARTSRIATEIGRQCALPESTVERLSYAALLHDVGAMIEGEHRAGVGREAPAAHVVRNVSFLRQVLPVLEVFDGADDSRRDAEDVQLSGFIVAMASDIDAMASACLEHGSCVARIARDIPSRTKARAVGAALSLGYSVPAVD